MAHFAKVNEDKIVIEVLVTDNDFPNEGYDWLIETFGGRWVKTSYNANQNGFRKHFAGVGFSYNEELDAFIPPKLFESWKLNPETCDWDPPVPYPEDGKDYNWDEDSLTWKEITND